jgi:hypothetical protein
MRTTLKLAALLALVLATGNRMTASVATAAAAGPAMESIGPIAFGPGGVLFAADRQAASILAIDLGSQSAGATTGTADVADLSGRIAAMLGTAPSEVTIADLAVHPTSRNAFVAVMRGQGANAQAALVRVDGAGKVDLVSMEGLTFTSVKLPNPAEVTPNGRGGRAQSVTDLAFSDGRLYVAGLSNEEFASKLWSVAYPFAASDRGTSVEIYHGSHGQLETRAPIMAFLPVTIDNQPYIVGGYTCTPLVKFSIASLKPGDKVMGTTIAEFGAGNQPLDMIAYQKDGQRYLLMSNSSRGVIKIPTRDFGSASAITEPVGGRGTAGIQGETIASMTGIEQLDLLDSTHTVVIARNETGTRSLSAVALP